MTNRLHELWTPEDQATFIVDADSTAIGAETLDTLAKLVMGAEAMTEFHALTDNGMLGTMSFSESLERRFGLMNGARREHVIEAGQQIVGLLDPTIVERRGWIEENPDRIHVVSGGFEELIGPAMKELGVCNLHANRLVYDDDGFVVGADPSRLTSQDGGKAALVASLELEGKVVVVGDGVNDLQIRDGGHADLFVAYTRYKERECVVRSADAVVDSFAEPLLT